MYLHDLFGSETAEKVLLFLQNYKSGYGQKIAKTYGISISQVQKQLLKLEHSGILVSHLIGKTRLFQWNPRYMFLAELQALLDKALENMPADYAQKYYRQRMRPRRTGKPLP